MSGKIINGGPKGLGDSLMRQYEEMDESSEDTRDMVQSVILTLSDGSTARFSGRAVCPIGETRTIKNIQFTEPKELPEGCSFDSI